MLGPQKLRNNESVNPDHKIDLEQDVDGSVGNDRGKGTGDRFFFVASRVSPHASINLRQDRLTGLYSIVRGQG